MSERPVVENKKKNIQILFLNTTVYSTYLKHTYDMTR